MTRYECRKLARWLMDAGWVDELDQGDGSTSEEGLTDHLVEYFAAVATEQLFDPTIEQAEQARGSKVKKEKGS